MAEWSKAHAWKVCIRQRIEGSNPSLSANNFGVLAQLVEQWTLNPFVASSTLARPTNTIKRLR